MSQTKIKTFVARALVGDNLFCGQSTQTELIPDGRGFWDLVQMTFGLEPGTVDAEIMDTISVALAAADPRIYPLRNVYFAGSATQNWYKALSIGSHYFNDTFMGPQMVVQTGALLVSDEPYPMTFGTDGFGVPKRPFDERFTFLNDWFPSELQGKYFKKMRAAIASAETSEGLKDSPPNITIVLAAILLDLGFPPDSLGAVAHILVSPTLWANTYESIRREPVLPVEYGGPAPRVSPRKQASDGG